MTADQILQKYLQAVGGYAKINAVHSFVEKGDVYGQLVWRGPSAPSGAKDRANFESYFVAPNFRLNQIVTKEGAVLSLKGCDGRDSWYTDSEGQRSVMNPTDSNPYECKPGVELVPIDFLDPSVQTELKGKKKIGSRSAWEIRLKNSREHKAQSYFVDDQTFLLVRRDASMTRWIYSDYTDVEGIKIPFSVRREGEFTETTTLRQIDINPPLKDINFDGLGGRKKTVKKIEQNQAGAELVKVPGAEPVEKALSTNDATASAPVLPAATYVKTINFASCSLSELRDAIPESEGLKQIEDQRKLDALLARAGEKTAELDRQIPNLISREKILESQAGLEDKQEEFSYLVLSRVSNDLRVLEEYRVDTKTGEAFEMGANGRSGATAGTREAALHSLSRASEKVAAGRKGSAPLSQGFASMWINFYPGNRQESDFRLLGTQKMDRHRTYVVAFAQKRGVVRLPGEVRFEGKSMPVYYQGVAWIDANDFRIIRLRTDLLPPIGDLPITQLTASVEFASTKTQGFNTELWLPREVEVNTEFSGREYHNKHTYSNYRSFQAHARLVIPQ